MFVQLIALAGILYYSSKELGKTDSADKLKEFRDSADIPDTAMSQRMNQLFKDVEQTHSTGSGQAGAVQKIKSPLQAKNEKELAIAAGTFALNTVADLSPRLAILGPLSVPLIIYSSWPIHRNTLKMLKKRKVNVNTLMTLTIIGVLLRGQFLIASLLIFIVKVAFYLTDRIAYNSKNQLTGMFDRHPDQVWLWVDGVEVSVPFASLQTGDIVVVQAGGMIPADGVIVAGMATIDQHVLTGEAQPVEREIGGTVFAATLVLSGQIKFRVEKAGDETIAAKIKTILKETIEYKSTVQLRAETFSEQLVKPVFAAAGIALPLLGVHGALAVMSTHPKNKTMILSPISMMNHLNLASRQGILIKDGRSLELLVKVDTLVFDKTGTLTEEQPHVGRIHCCPGADEETVLRHAAAAEYRQTHPLAKAILSAAALRGIETPALEESEYLMGYGLIVNLEGRRVHVGSERFMQHENIALPAEIQAQQQQAHADGYSLVMVAVDRVLIGAIELLPTVRPEIKAVIASLKQHHGIRHTYIISGDNEAPTRKLAEELGIDHYFAQVMPQDKAARIQELQDQGHFVCYVGDGINDAIALKTAQVSVSLRGASTIAVDTAQIVLLEEGLAHLDTLFALAKQFNRNMNQTFAILLVPAALGVTGAFLLHFGIVQTVMLNMTGLALGLGNVMYPLIQHRGKSVSEQAAPETREAE